VTSVDNGQGADATIEDTAIKDGAIIYDPGPEARSKFRIGAYMDWLEAERGLSFDDYHDLWQWSVDDIDAFWRSIWDHFGVQSATPVGEVLGRREMPGAQWFPGATINYTGQYLQAAAGRESEIAIIGESQTRDTVEWTHADLIDTIGRVRAGLLSLGVGQGDRVVAFMPNLPETVAAFLATASIGATWASAAPEFGPRAVIDRFGQLEPTVLLAVDGYHYGDKDIDIRDRVATIFSAIPSIQQVVTFAYNGRDLADGLIETASADNRELQVVDWADFTSEAGPVDVAPVPFDHPLCVLFSSGTTGLPKAIVHGHGGITLEAYKNHVLSWDLGPGDRLMWFTTTAWMMWNALVSTLLTGAAIICLDGNPMWPDLSAQWRLAERLKPTMMGLGPAYIMNCIKAGVSPTDEFDLSTLRMLSAAGSPLPAEGFVWLFEQFGAQAPCYVGSGGTDVCSGLLQGYPIVPVYAGEISSKVLGVAAYAFDEDGNSVVGELGELVITKPMPSMPVRFWGDDEMTRYRATYYEQYPGIMRFGDWVRFTEHNTSVVTGRSDATLNRGGVRIGTAEIYRVVEQMPEVTDSLAVHLEDPDGGMGQLMLFVQPANGELDDGLRAAIATALKQALSPRHVPDDMHGVGSVPRNLTGKKLELPIKRILQGTEPDKVISREAMANPDSLDEYIRLIDRLNAASPGGA
jgi:acetoacetyl-CoA synthetase